MEIQIYGSCSLTKGRENLYQAPEIRKKPQSLERFFLKGQTALNRKLDRGILMFSFDMDGYLLVYSILVLLQIGSEKGNFRIINV